MHLLERSLADYGLHCAVPYMDEEIRACWGHTANKNWNHAPHHASLDRDYVLIIIVSTSQGLVSCSGNVYEIGHLLMTVWPRIWNVMSAGESSSTRYLVLGGPQCYLLSPCFILRNLRIKWNPQGEGVKPTERKNDKDRVCFALRQIRPLKMIHQCISQFVQLMSIWVVSSLGLLWIKLP